MKPEGIFAGGLARLGKLFLFRKAPRPDLARYAASWRDLLRSDARALFDTAGAASAALRQIDGLAFRR